MNSVVPLRSGNTIAPIVPRTIEEVARLASGIKKSGLSASGMDTEEKIIVAILHGLEIGLPPMQAIQRIAVIHGRPTIWGDALPALLWARGFKLREWTEGDTAHCEVTRPDGEKVVRTFSDADAKAAGLLNKSGPWTQYKSRMRQMRARGFACRDGAADVLAGLYLAEEMQDAEMKDVTPREAIAELPDIPDVPDIPDAVDDIPPDDVPAVFDPRTFVDNYRNDMTLMPPDERQDYCDANSTSIEMLPADLQEEVDAINRELVP